MKLLVLLTTNYFFSLTKVVLQVSLPTIYKTSNYLNKVLITLKFKLLVVVIIGLYWWFSLNRN